MKKIALNALRKVTNIINAGSEPDLKRELQKIATRNSAEYIRKNMIDVQSVSSLYSVHDAAIDKAKIKNGLVLEFGVFSGSTINYIASKGDFIVDGFDSFEGLPENWRDGFDKGRFRVSALPKVR